MIRQQASVFLPSSVGTVMQYFVQSSLIWNVRRAASCKDWIKVNSVVQHSSDHVPESGHNSHVLQRVWNEECVCESWHHHHRLQCFLNRGGRNRFILILVLLMRLTWFFFLVLLSFVVRFVSSMFPRVRRCRFWLDIRRGEGFSRAFGAFDVKIDYFGIAAWWMFSRWTSH